MIIQISIQKLAKIITVYLFITLIGIGLYSAKQASNGAYEEWVTVADGVITNKIVVLGDSYLVINDKQVKVDSETYQTSKVNDKISLGHNVDRMPAWRVILAFLSCVVVGIASLIISINFLIWLYCHSDSESYFKYFKKSFS